MELTYLADHTEFIPTIARWYIDEWGHLHEGSSVDKTCEMIKQMLNRDVPPVHMIALEDGNLLGAAQLKIREMSIFPTREFWLGGVYVVETARGRGVARALAEKVAEIARSFNIKTLYLQTEKRETGGLYGKLGWQPLEKLHYGGLNVLVMERKL